MLGYVQHSVHCTGQNQTKTTANNSNRADKLKMGEKREKMSQQKRFRYAQAQQNPPVHWFDKFPSARRMN